MLTDIQNRKMMYAYRVKYQGMKSRITIRELIPIIGFFDERGQWTCFVYNSSGITTANNLNETIRKMF